MSTRATYEFNTLDDWCKSTTLYIHHDGYPEGAATYFYKAFVHSGHISAESMIRANDNAEITDSHNMHGDTEYRYTFTGGHGLRVEERHTLIEFGSYPAGWRTIFTGDWIDFVNEYAPKGFYNGTVEQIRRVDIGHMKDRPHTPSSLNNVLNDDLRTCGMWATNDNESGESANMRSLKDRIREMRGLLLTYGQPTWRAA